MSRYGVNACGRVICKRHQQAHPANEACPWCAPPVAKAPLDPYELDGSCFANYVRMGWLLACPCVLCRIE